MIITDFVKYGLEKINIEKAISEINFSADLNWWSRFRWGLYKNGVVFILFEENRYYGNIVRPVAYLNNDNQIITKDCSSGNIDCLVLALLDCPIEYLLNSNIRCLTKYSIENLFDNMLPNA